MRHRFLKNCACEGSALVLVFLCIVLLGGLLSAASMAVIYERQAIAHRQEVLRAEIAVQAAFAVAQSLLCKAIAQYPDSASVWEEHLPGLETPGTALHIFQRTASDQSAHILVLPLVSGVREAWKAREPPWDFSSDFCDLNRLPPENWVGGAMQPDGKAVSIRVPWVRLSSTQSGTSPFLSRYAFLIEDESFKLNVEQASLDSHPFLRSAKDISLPAILAQLPGITQPTQGKELYDLRERLGGFANLEETHPVLRLTSADWDRWKFISTVHSEALNRTRRGFPRTNLKKLFEQTSSTKEVRRQLDGFTSAISRESPHFGQRFYRPNNASFNDPKAVSEEHEKIYLNKLAANVRDFLLPGANPTLVLAAHGYPVVDSSSLIEVPYPANAAAIGPNPFVAIGKKRIPYLQEYALAARLIRMEAIDSTELAHNTRSPARNSGANFTMTIDHFLEFWNMSDQPIRLEDLGPNARLNIRNQPEWDLGKRGNGIPLSSERNIDILLKNFESSRGEPLVFKPGDVTVLTTFPGAPPSDLFRHGSDFFRPNTSAMSQLAAQRSFSGVTYRINEENKQYEVATQLRNNGWTDHETEYLLMNDHGWIDGFGYLPVLWSIAMRKDNGQEKQGVRWHVRSSALAGETSKNEERGPNQTGDPRTLNEQLRLGETKSGGGKSLPHTRFLSTLGENILRKKSAFPGKSSLGALHSPFATLPKWPDPLRHYWDLERELKYPAPMVFLEGPLPKNSLKTVAELGHVFDPIRNLRGDQMERDRGGGRTLRIGQPEFFSNAPDKKFSLWDRNPLSPSREWTAWRLCDIFSVANEPRLPGAVNINGVLRADGAALRALLSGFRWNGVGADELGGFCLEGGDIQLLVEHFQKRIRGQSPYRDRGGAFFERGEISEIDLFQSEEVFPGPTANRSEVGLARRPDRIREQIVHSILEALTTRGNIFSAYCVGQAVRETPNGPRILATRRTKFTFRLVPVDSDGRRMEEFAQQFPADSQRIIAPVRYLTDLLAVED